MKNLFTYFIQGLFYTVPLGLTFYVVFNSFMWLDDLIPVKIPGLGIIIVVALVTGIGYLGSAVLSSQIGFLIRSFEKIILKIPLVKMIYTALKDITSTLTGSNRTFDQAALVTLDKTNNIQKIGFITKTDLTSMGVAEDMVSVYFPYSYGIMGDLRIVPKSSIKPITGKPAEIMKFIVSGGIVQIEDSKD